MNQADLIWMNGELVAWEDAKVHVLTHALHYGTGVFEGIRAYETPRGTAIFRHADHVERLFRSAGMYLMDIPYTREELRAATHETIVRNSLRSCYIRPLVYRGAGPMGLYPLDSPVEVAIAVWEWGAYLGDEGKQRGVRGKVSSFRRISSDSVIPAAKATGQYVNSVLAKIEVSKAGYEEAILLDDRGMVCEGSGENLFVVKDGVIATPGLQRRHPRRDQPRVGDHDRARPRLRGRRARRRAGRALPRRRDLHDRHRRRAHAAARGRRPAGRDGRAGRDHPHALGRVPRRAVRPLGPLRGVARRRRGARAHHVSRVTVYDCTLRDGMQGEGMSLSASEKLRVAHVLDQLGIPLIEAGFPSSNPKEAELFDLLAAETFANAEIAAFGMTRRRGVAAADDEALRLLAASFAPVTTIVGKTWGLHLEKVVRVDRDENLRMIEDSVAFLVREGKTVVYDAEHFFDGWRDDPDYALRCARAAAEAGAAWVTLCDTNGASLPHEVEAATAAVAEALDAPVGIHCHNDAECGVANSLAAVRAGARMVQGTMNGYGERCGNANLVSIVPNLQLKLGHECVPELTGLTEASHLLDELLNFVPDPNRPYVGQNAFAHKGGMHVAGVAADPATFEHIDPAAVGNAREVLISELSGKGTVLQRAEATGVELDAAAAARVVERVKQLEHEGFHFEAADGSFDLLIRRETGEYAPLFRLESWRVIAEKREDGRVQTEATIKIWVEGERYVRTAEGNGPVNALDAALRAAISETYPHLGDIRLVNYKVRILDEQKATGAVTRVLLDASDGKDTWGAIGVSENVIEASWDALVDSLEAGMLPGRIRHTRGATTTA